MKFNELSIPQTIDNMYVKSRYNKLNLEAFFFKELLFFISLAIFVVTFLFDYKHSCGKQLLYSALILNYLIIITRCILQKNVILLIVFLFFFQYIYTLYYPFFTNITWGAFANEYTLKYYFKIAQLGLLFISTLGVFLKIEPSSSFKIQPQRNDILFIFSISFFSFLTIIGKSGEGLLSGNYGSMDAQISTSFEYAIIPFIGALLFCYTKKQRFLIYILALFYILKNTLYGGRIESVMIIISLFVFIFVHKLSFKSILILFCLGIYLMTLVGHIRYNPTLLLENDWGAILSIKSEKTYHIVNQESEVNYSSSTFLMMLDSNIIKGYDIFWAFIKSLFLPSKYVEKSGNLSLYTQGFFSNLGGGLIYVYFFVYASYIGVLFIAMFIAKLFNCLKTFNVNFITILALFSILTFPRWFAYSPTTLFKMSLYGTVFCWILLYLHRKFRKNESTSN